MAAQKNGSTAAPATKMEAVAWTLQELGSDTTPLAIKDHLKKRYHIDISAAVASDYKKQLKKKAKASSTPAPGAEASPGKKAAPPARKSVALGKQAAPSANGAEGAQPPATSPQAARKVSGPSGDNILLADVLTLKALLCRVGPDKLRQLIDGLAK